MYLKVIKAYSGIYTFIKILTVMLDLSGPTSGRDKGGVRTGSSFLH